MTKYKHNRTAFIEALNKLLTADGLKRAFIKEELMLIPEDTELSPNFVQK